MSRLLGFEVSVLRQLPGETVAIPFGRDGRLGWYLKLSGKRVFSNDLRQSASWQAVGKVENNGYVLSAVEIQQLLDEADAFVQQTQGTPENQRLLGWFAPTQAAWLDGYRKAALTLDDRSLRGLALTLGQRIGEYWRSFDSQTHHLQLPIDDVLSHFLDELHQVVDNRRENLATNLDAHQFVIQVHADLVYAHLPSAKPLAVQSQRPDGWTEVWITGNPDIWETLTASQRNRFGGQLMTRTKYREVVKGFLKRLRHFPGWVISVNQPGPLSTEEMVQLIEEHRPVEKIYSKDATEFLDGFTQHLIVSRL